MFETLVRCRSFESWLVLGNFYHAPDRWIRGAHHFLWRYLFLSQFPCHLTSQLFNVGLQRCRAEEMCKVLRKLKVCEIVDHKFWWMLLIKHAQAERWINKNIKWMFKLNIIVYNTLELRMILNIYSFITLMVDDLPIRELGFVSGFIYCIWRISTRICL